MALRPRTQPSSPPSSLISITNHDDQPLWEDVPDDDNRRCVLMEAYGDTDTGRSTFALTAPGPIAYIHTYEKVGGLFQPIKKAGKEVRPCKVGGVMRGSTEEVMALASAAAARLEHAIADAYSWARSIILDTHTEMWQIIQLARLGSLSRDERKEKDIQKGQLVYAEINARWKSIMKHHRVQADLTNYTNLIIIGQTTEEYKKVPNSHSNAKQATGRTIAAGMKETGYLCDVRLRLKRSRESEFSAVIEKPWNAGHLRGFEVEGEQLNFADIMGMITETDASEWS